MSARGLGFVKICIICLSLLRSAVLCRGLFRSAEVH